MAKVLKRIVEDEVTFLTNVNVEYVSLVNYAANRTPFKILKSDKGGSDMSKVITAVLIPKALSAEDATAQLKGYRDDEVKEFDTYKSYIQVDQDTVDPDSIEVVFLDSTKGVLGIVASMKDEKKDEPAPAAADAPKEEPAAATAAEKNDDPKPADPPAPEAKTPAEPVVEPAKLEKEALDYATMDSIYTEMWAMADLMSGAMRQAEMTQKDRVKIIMTAVDNFRTFVEMVFSSGAKMEAVKAENHPTLLHHVTPMDARKAEKQTIECPECGMEVDCGGDKKVEKKAKTASFDSEVFKAAILTEVGTMISVFAKAEDVTALKTVVDDIKKSVDTVTNTLKGVDELKTKIDSVEKGVGEKITKITTSVEKLENTPVAAKGAEVDDVTPPTEPVEKGGVLFKGSIFRSRE